MPTERARYVMDLRTRLRQGEISLNSSSTASRSSSSGTPRLRFTASSRRQNFDVQPIALVCGGRPRVRGRTAVAKVVDARASGRRRAMRLWRQTDADSPQKRRQAGSKLRSPAQARRQRQVRSRERGRPIPRPRARSGEKSAGAKPASASARVTACGKIALVSIPGADPSHLDQRTVTRSVTASP